MAVEEYECHGCSSTFVIPDNERCPEEITTVCPRCKSPDVERYYFPRDACRLYNLVKPDPDSK